MTERMRFNERDAVAIYHSFVCLAYVMPVFGAVVADGFLGKYRTILYLSVVYLFGNLIMMFTAVPPIATFGPLLGLAIIAVGTGGIKPCVSAFAGDQFAVTQEVERNRFFSMFYFAINLGSFLSMLVTPAVRAYAYCFESHCYMLAFGIPAALMILALALFVVGRKFYVINPPLGSVIQRMISCIVSALRNRFRKSADVAPKGHWLEYADDAYDLTFRNEVRMVLHLLMMYVPLPMFYALFDQQGSSWTLQCTKMDLRIAIPMVDSCWTTVEDASNPKYYKTPVHAVASTDYWYLLPDQMQAINSFLVLLFIPLFEFIIYPFTEKNKIDSRPLRRMVLGMTLAAIAFLVAGGLQIAIELTLQNSALFDFPVSRFNVINSSPCIADFSGPLVHTTLGKSQMSNGSIEASGKYKVIVSSQCSKYRSRRPHVLEVTLLPHKAYVLHVDDNGGKLNSRLIQYPAVAKSKLGDSAVSTILTNALSNAVHTIVLQKSNFETVTFNVSSTSLPEFKQIPVGSLICDCGSYDIYVSSKQSSRERLNEKPVVFGNGAVHVITVQTKFQFQDFVLVHHNTISVLYQIPQYVILTVGEILFSITGLSFAYSQAPESMKSVVQAGWLLTTAVGNLIDVVIGGIHYLDQVAKFFLFATLMGVATAVFAIMAYFYEYIDYGKLSISG